MRTTIIILAILTLIGCKDNEEKTVSKNDRLEFIPEPDKDLREKYEQQQKNSLTTNSSYQEFMGEELKPIRKKLRPLSNRQEWTAIDKRKIETKSANGVAVYYFLQDELKKVRFLQNTENTDRLIEYYLENGSLFFVFEKQTDKLELKNDPENYEPYEDSLFFKNDELIKIKSNMDCGAPFAEDYRKKIQEDLNTEFVMLFNRLKK